MEVIKTALEGVVIIEPRVFKDDRGYFFESFSQREFEEKVRPINFVQDNESFSIYGVIRAFHCQKPPYAQSKLVQCMKGVIRDVVVDLRYGSPTYLQSISVDLSDNNKKMLFVPRGFLHGFSVLSKEAKVLFKCDNYYSPQSELAIAWNDSTLNIDWGVPLSDVIIANKDKNNPELLSIDKIFFYNKNLY